MPLDSPLSTSDLFAPASAAVIETVEVPPLAPIPVGEYPSLGEVFGDFVILRELGRGAFAAVYLARQISLDREVALKISDRPGHSEGLALAGLEHDHIVKVYSEFNDSTCGRYGLCLQYVPGPTLAQVIAHLYRRGVPHSGKAIVDALDALATETVGFDPGALRFRDELTRGHFAEAVCRLGAKLAEALAFAHARGVLHCDIKPANILLNRYGKPLLADFNVAVDQSRTAGSGVGGTWVYMAPEHLRLFLSTPREPGGSVDARSDLYSLGIVLVEFLTGQIPLPSRSGKKLSDSLIELLAFRQQPLGAMLTNPHRIPPVLERVLNRCLHPDPNRRYPNAQALVEALLRAAELTAIESSLPPDGLVTRLTKRHPFAMILFVLLSPHLLASVVNIAYNSIEIQLQPVQQAAFISLIAPYNALVYLACISTALCLLQRIRRDWDRHLRREPMTGPEVDRLRRRFFQLSTLQVFLALGGWLPGGIYFPLGIDLLAGHVTWQTYAHFFISFALCCVITLIYSYLAIQFLVFRVFLPPLLNAESSRAATEAELHRAGRWLGAFQILAAIVPLTGALLLVISTAGTMTLDFRLLVTGLIVLGMMGLGSAVMVIQYLNGLLKLLTR